MTRGFSGVYLSRWYGVWFVSSNLLKLTLVHLEERVLCETDTEFFTGLLQCGVEDWKTAMVHSREQVVQPMVTEVCQSSEQGTVYRWSLSHGIQLSQTPVPVNSETTAHHDLNSEFGGHNIYK
jgi:hypothetical protein